MKLIEGLKQIKELNRKADDLKDKVRDNCVLTNFDTPKYEAQGQKIKEWIQSHTDIIKEILRLNICIQKTNLDTQVDIELGGKIVNKSIAEWIHRRRSLSIEDLSIWNKLTDRGLKEGIIKTPAGENAELKIIRFYSPEERDKMLELYTSEKGTIDSRLEVVNAVTDLQE